VRAVVQRVAEAAVRVEGALVSEIGAGLVILLGVGKGDRGEDADALADKVLHLRILRDGDGHMNRSVVEAAGALLVVSQFTLYGDARKGRRPGFSEAAPPDLAEALYRRFVSGLLASGLEVKEGVFRADMKVSLVNDGPVTLLLDSRKLF
jgi:D-tyrosyl-tRNA(Tyr) deacylase